jgi:hypothetical protein
MVKLTGFSEQATAEVGVSSAAVGAANRFAVTRSGTLTYWNGTGYTQVLLNPVTPSGTYTLGSLDGSYVSGTSSITVKLTGDVKVSAATTEKGAPPNCQPDSCTGKSNAGSVVATVHYLVQNAGVTVANFTVQVDLGAVFVNTTYRAVPVV